MLAFRFRNLLFLPALALCAGYGVGAHAQGTGGNPGNPPSSTPTGGVIVAASSDAFSGPIRKGDSLRVVVAGEDAMGGDFRVESDGMVSIPRLDSFDLAGKKMSDAAALISRRIEEKQLLKHAEVTVYIIGRKIRSVVVNGAITAQGPQVIKDNTVLSQVVESASPLAGADLSRVVVTHSDGTTQTVNYKKFRNGEANSPEVNPLLLDDDHIYVYAGNATEGTVRVVGEAKDQTKLVIPISAGMTVGQVLQLVGGVSEYADRGGIYVNRAGQRLPVSYDDILRNTRGKDIVLQDRDEIDIPRLDKPRRVTVAGAVKDAKSEPLLTSLTLLESVAQAGGPVDGAQQNKVEVRRRDNTGSLTTRVYDLTKDGDASTELIDGDYVFVPYPKNRGRADAGAVAGVLSGLAVFFSVFRR